MTRKVTLIKGDGIGPEVIEAALFVLEKAGANIEFEEAIAGEEAIKKFNTPLPDETLELIKKNKIALKGPITTPIGGGFRSVNVAIRQALELYACLRPCRYYEGVKSNYPNVDIVIVRENTEDLYAGVEFAPESEEAKKIVEMGKGKIRKGSAISIKPISREASERIASFAFEHAVENNRKKVTAITKANIMKFTDGLFFESTRRIAKQYEGKVEYEERLIDNMCMQLVQKPELYDIVVCPNLYGDILSDLCAGLVGGLGMAPGANMGKDYAVFEPVHGSAPKYAGLNKVNPCAAILSAAMMLRYMKMPEKATAVERAVADVIKEGKHVTYDLGGSAKTMEMARAIGEKINSLV